MNPVKKARAYFKLISMSGGSKFKDIDIEQIPKEWEKFQDSDDQWIGVVFPESEDITACLYLGKKGSVFKPHKHKNIEHFTVINPNGRVKVTTQDEIKVLQFPESIAIDKNKVHACEFIEETKILIMWSPKFENGWSAKFEKE